MLRRNFSQKLIFSIFALGLLFLSNYALASETEGTIDTTFKYAWSENFGWINFGCDNCDVSITDEGITGRAWSTQYGWINLNPTNSGITNDGEGILSGSAWGSNIGWIDFDGVTINEEGEFLGYATINSDASQINFNCVNGGSCSAADFKVATDWRPASTREEEEDGDGTRTSGGGSSGGDESDEATPETTPSTSIPTYTPPATSSNPVTNIVKEILDFFTPEPEVVEVPVVAPLALSGVWSLLPTDEIQSFVFAPLPYEIQILAAKFPELANTFAEVGIERFTDIDKLVGVTLNIPDLADKLNETIQTIGLNNLPELDNLTGVSLDIPGLSNLDELLTPGIGSGTIALIEGLPLANFPLAAKRNLPSEFVFARAGGELVDLNVALSVGETGEVTQKISTLPGKTLKLVVKPISSTNSVTGYIVFRSATPKITQNQISRESLVASALFSMNELVEQVPTSPPAPLLSGEGGQGPGEVENKLVLTSFEYTDPDHDGIFTADVDMPVVPGEYEVITVIAYKDPTLGTRQIRMTTVVDPEGYVYEENGGKETRIPSAIVSLYYLNPITKNYELWPAKNYQQENPQITDIRGTYSFLVPEGSYYFSVEAPGYDSYEGKVFVVREGSGVHQNIELKPRGGIFHNFDWKTALLIVVLLLLVYNLYRNRHAK